VKECFHRRRRFPLLMLNQCADQARVTSRIPFKSWIPVES
jgi:hypothetical protein